MATGSVISAGYELHDYRILGLLGRGGFKAVYEAENLRAEENGHPASVAICVPHYQDDEARDLLHNEFRVVAGLGHPAIPKVYALEEHAGQLFIVMELVEGRSLAEVLSDDGPLPLEAAVEIAARVGEALDYAHAGLAIHRDIKPANIMRCPDGSVKVLDFGLARLMAHSNYKAETRVGSVAYMAPEQFEGAAGLNADLWALGVTFFRLVTNVFPFVGDNEASLVKQILYDTPSLEPIEDLQIDRRLARVVAKALEKDPEQRYQQAREFTADLRAVVRHAATVNHVEGNIEVHLRAHFPLLYIHTHEEERALASLRRVRMAMSEAKSIELYVWSETRGLRDREGRLLSPHTVGDPLTALEHVFSGADEGIYVFLDMHRHFTPISVRLIRDAVWTVKRKRKSLVFISPALAIPDELAADTTLLFYDTPDAAELARLVDRVAEENAAPLEGDLRDRLARAVLGLTEREAERVLLRGLVTHGELNDACAAEALREKEQVVRKEGVLEFCRRETSFDDVGGLDLLKSWFETRRQAFGAAGRRFGLRAPRGVVLVGVPGCGKSLSAKALASAWDVPLLRLDMGRVYESFLGASEANLRRALHTAELVSPCVLWIDELEKAFAGLGQDLDGGVTQRLFGAFLTWLEDRAAPVFVVATANDTRRLPPEFTRKGRFDEVFFVDLPGARERESIFDVHLRKRDRDSERFALGELAEKAEGYSGAEIEEAIVSGLYRAFEEDCRELSDDDIRGALAASVPLSRSRKQDLVYMQRWAAQNARAAQAS